MMNNYLIGKSSYTIGKEVYGNKDKVEVPKELQYWFEKYKRISARIYNERSSVK